MAFIFSILRSKAGHRRQQLPLGFVLDFLHPVPEENLIILYAIVYHYYLSMLIYVGISYF